MKYNHIAQRCRALALAGILGASLLSSGAAYAIGPGETPGSAQTAGGPGAVTQNTNTSSSAAETPSNPNAWKKVNGVYQMPDGSSIQNVLSRGIDVSRWQEEVNWSQVASDDISFVMLGTRSKGEVDPYFHRNIQQASAAGIKVGVYIYSLATTPEMAVAEADFVLNLIHDYPISYPVAFDMEDSTQGVLSKEELAAIANAFCKRISDSGYYPIIYANEYWLQNKLDMSKMNYPVWVARYSGKPTYSNPVMWQATSTGSVKGINGNVDINYQFTDFTSRIPSNLWRTVNGNRFYYSNYRKQKNGWAPDGSDWYYMDENGNPAKGWKTLSGIRYYLDSATGKMATGWKSDNGNWYYLDGSGALKTGWINDGGSWYYSSSDGIMQTGWLTDGGKKYYLKGSGAMATGWREMDRSWYYFENSGAMATGWKQLGGVWYYLNSSGAMATGMVQIDGAAYYLDPASGAMAANTELQLGDGRYRAAADGSLSRITEETQSETEAGPQTPPAQTEAPAGSSQSQPGQSDVPVVTPVGQSKPAGESSGAEQVAPGSSHVSGVNGGPGV